MKWEKPTAQEDLLPDHWRRWTAIIELFVERHGGRRRVDPHDYAVLRSSLISTCRSLAQAQPDAKRRSYYTALEETVRPWLTPQVIGRTDHEILSGLLSRCRQIELELTGRRRWAVRRPSAVVPALFIAAGSIVFGTVWYLMEFGHPLLEALREAGENVWLAITTLSSLQAMSVMAIVIIAAAIYLASRTARS